LESNRHSPKLGLQPGPSGTPVSLDGANGNSKGFGCFLLGQASEIYEFYQPTLPGIHLREARESLIQHQQPIEMGMLCGVAIFEFNLLSGTGSLSSTTAAGVIDKDPPHDDTRHSQKVGAPLPFDRLMAQELEKGLMHEGGGL
jgi:hypothetical protein